MMRKNHSGHSLAHVMTGPSITSMIFLVVVVCYGLLYTSGFATAYNVQATLIQLGPAALLATAAAVAMHGGVADLSIASTFGLGGMTFATILSWKGSVALAIICGIVAGVLVGVFNGVVSVRFGVNPLIATLGMFVAARGLVRVIGGGKSVAAYRPSLIALLTTTLWIFSVVFLIVVALAICAWFGIARTRWGRHLVAVGGDEMAATRAGIHTHRIRWCLFLLTGGAAGLAGVIQAAEIGAAPVDLGVGLELQVYAALLIAGYRIAGGGKGNPVVGLVSLLALAFIMDIFQLRGIPLPLHDLVLGLALLGAMLLDVWRGRVARIPFGHSPVSPSPTAGTV